MHFGGGHLFGVSTFAKEVEFLGLRGVWVPRDSALFQKMKCIFSIAPVGILEKSWECFSLRNTHRTQCVEAPDAGPSVRCAVSA